MKGIEKLFRSLVLKLLIREGKLSTDLAEKMRSWKHSGFRDLPGTSSLTILPPVFRLS